MSARSEYTSLSTRTKQELDEGLDKQNQLKQLDQVRLLSSLYSDSDQLINILINGITISKNQLEKSYDGSSLLCTHRYKIGDFKGIKSTKFTSLLLLNFEDSISTDMQDALTDGSQPSVIEQENLKPTYRTHA